MSTDDAPDLALALDRIDRLIVMASEGVDSARTRSGGYTAERAEVIANGSKLLDRLTAAAARLRPVVLDERLVHKQREVVQLRAALRAITQQGEAAGLTVDEWPERLRPVAEAIAQHGSLRT